MNVSGGDYQNMTFQYDDEGKTASASNSGGCNDESAADYQKHTSPTNTNANSMLDVAPLETELTPPSQLQNTPRSAPSSSSNNQRTALSLPKKKSSILGASSNLVNSIVGAGIIGIPYALRMSGLWAGVVLLILVAALTGESKMERCVLKICVLVFANTTLFKQRWYDERRRYISFVLRA